MEDFFSKIKCALHNQKCFSIKMNSNTSFEDKIECPKCLINKSNQLIQQSQVQQSNQNENVLSKDIEDIIKEISQRNSLKQESTKKYFSQHLNILDQYKNQLNLLIKLCEQMKSEINSQIQIIEEMNQPLIKNENIQNDEMNKMIEMIIKQSLENYQEEILKHQSQSLKNTQQKVIENEIKLNQCDQEIQKLKQIVQNIKKWTFTIDQQQNQLIQSSQIDRLKENQEQQKKIITQNQIDKQNNTPKPDYQYNQIGQIESDPIFCIEFNKDNSLLITGCKQKILVYSFIKEKLKLIQSLGEHKHIVNTLHFSKQSNTFISGSQDYYIKVFFQQESMKWVCQYSFKAHNNDVNCVLLNQYDNEIISSSFDLQVNIWNINGNQKQSFQQDQQPIYQLDYNSNESQFISRSILQLTIFSKEENKKWDIKQIINISSGYQACFLTDQLIACQISLQINLYKLKGESFQLEGQIPISEQNKQQYYNHYQYKLYFSKCTQQLFVKLDQFYYSLNIDLDKCQIKKCKTILEAIDQTVIGTISKDGLYFISGEEQKGQLTIQKYN